MWSFRNLSLVTLGVASSLAAWELAARLIDVPAILPSPWQLMRAVGEGRFLSGLLLDTLVSTGRVLAGYLLASLGGFALALVLVLSDSLRAAFQPQLAVARYIPTGVFIPILVALFGLGDLSKILAIFAGLVFNTTLAVVLAMTAVDKGYQELAGILRVSRSRYVFWIALPAAKGELLNLFRTNLAWAWGFVLIAELIAADSGLGYQIKLGLRMLQPERIYLSAAILCVLGLISDGLFRWTSKAKAEC